jgi:hypothetical protein
VHQVGDKNKFINYSFIVNLWIFRIFEDASSVQVEEHFCVFFYRVCNEYNAIMGKFCVLLYIFNNTVSHACVTLRRIQSSFEEYQIWECDAV